MQALVRGAWSSLYRFDLQPQLLPDYELANWFVSNYPESHFVKGLTVARPAEGCRYALANNQLSVHRLDGTTEQRTLRSAEELAGVLREVFGITLPDGPDLTAALTRLTASAGSASGTPTAR
jgi:N-hydroxyarylamine O-acetyltransferase